MPGTQLVWKLVIDGQIIYSEHSKSILEILDDCLDAMDIGSKEAFTISLIEMDVVEYENLQDYEGF